MDNIQTVEPHFGDMVRYQSVLIAEVQGSLFESDADATIKYMRSTYSVIYHLGTKYKYAKLLPLRSQACITNDGVGVNHTITVGYVMVYTASPNLINNDCKIACELFSNKHRISMY